MSEKQLILGVDVSQHQLDVACYATPKVSAWGDFKNQTDGFCQIQAMVKAQKAQQSASDVLIIIEPTGGYEQAFARFALSCGWQVALPNPRTVRHWATGMGIRAKTDKVDAAMLARYGAQTQPPRWNPPPEAIETLDQMLARLSELETMHRSETNRLAALLRQPVPSEPAKLSLETSLSFLSDQITTLKQEIDCHFEHHPKLQSQKHHLQSIPGVGTKNANFLLVALHRFTALTNGQGTSKALTAYAGLDPVPYESGTSVLRRPGISKQGNVQLRHYLFLGALGGKRGDNPLRAFYHRLIGRGKPKMVALIACARKILVWSWAIFKSNTVFDAQKVTTTF